MAMEAMKNAFLNIPKGNRAAVVVRENPEWTGIAVKPEAVMPPTLGISQINRPTPRLARVLRAGGEGEQFVFQYILWRMRDAL